MRHLAWAGMAVAVGIATAASCIPDFEFRQESSASGTGGGTGGTGGAGGQAGGPLDTTSSAGGTGGAGGEGGQPLVRQMRCGETTSMQCAPGELCCYHTTTIACDKCAQDECTGDGTCAAAGYAKFFCDDPDDCPAGQMCCMTWQIKSGQEYYSGAACQESCSDVQHRLCDEADDCDPGVVCVSIEYPGYMRCSQ